MFILHMNTGFFGPAQRVLKSLMVSREKQTKYISITLLHSLPKHVVYFFTADGKGQLNRKGENHSYHANIKDFKQVISYSSEESFRFKGDDQPEGGILNSF